MSEDGRWRTLSDGNSIPTVGLGVWQVPDGPECEDAVRWALEAGYRHIDTAQAYGNEASVGRAVRDSGIPREEIFITTKFYPARSDPAAEAEKSLERLGIDQIDLYIIHWPQKGATWAWPGMEAARERGYARSIGVSNFSVAELEEVIGVADTPPVVNQIQFSPFEYRRALRDACESHDVAVEAYSPLGTGRHLDDPDRGRGGRARRPHPSPGPHPLVPPARHDRAAQVDAPGAHRGQRPGVRLLPVRRGHGAARRAGPEPRHGGRARAQVVVTRRVSRRG